MASRTESSGQTAERSRKQLEFSKAMSDFKSMFPSVDYDVIEIVLRANNGLVDATVDQLLAMQGEQNQTENRLVDPDMNVRLPSYHDSSSSVAANEPPPAYTPRVEEDPNFVYDTTFLGPPNGNIDTATSSCDTATSHKTNGWNPPLLGTLPKDFLRLNVQSDGFEDRRRVSPSSHLGETSSSSRNHEVRAEALANKGMVGTPVTRGNQVLVYFISLPFFFQNKRYTVKSFNVSSKQ